MGGRSNEGRDDFAMRRRGAETFEDPRMLADLVAGTKDAYFLVDVRTPAEYSSGHIPTAINIPHTEISVKVPTSDRSALIIVYCRSGARSGAAMQTLQRLGYTRVVNFGAVSKWREELVSGSEAPQPR